MYICYIYHIYMIYIYMIYIYMIYIYMIYIYMIYIYMIYIYMIYIYTRATPGFCPGVAAYICPIHEQMMLQIIVIPMGKITQD